MTNPGFSCQRVFTFADQTAFAALSGDWNPMHIDAVAARRTQAGAPVVHGVHAAVWALDAYAARYPLGPGFLHLSVRFERFIFLEQTVEARLIERDPDGFLIALSVGGSKVVSLRGEARDSAQGSSLALPATPPPAPLARPRDLEAVDLAGVEDQFVIPGTPEALSAAFPSLVRSLGAGAVGSLISLSTLVGMHAPGLHSIFSKFTVSLGPEMETQPLRYRVAKVQPLLRAADIEVAGAGLRGSVGAFVRRPPVRQPSSVSIADGRALNCVGDRVLIVGGSRGLGEVAAKLCAMGGADVTITYAVGAEDAEAVRADILASGGRCSVCRLDVTEPVAAQLASVSVAFTHVYYFATSRIFGQKANLLSRDQLSIFLDVHLHGLKAVCDAVTASGQAVKCFYPSSVAVEEKPEDAIEYVIAKVAGELLADALTASVPGLTVLVKRLPRTDTDQTATVLPVKSARAVEVIRPIVERMHAAVD